MNGILLEGEALSRCGKSLLAMIDNEASFERIVDDLQQLEEEVQVGRAEQQGVICLAMQNSAEGSVASEAGAETAMPIVDFFTVQGRCTAAPQLTIHGWALLKALYQLKVRLRRLGSK
jgi:hypothetical protein